MKNLRIYIALLTAGCIVASCEKDITVDLPEVEKKVVVDGAIFEGEKAYVALTYSFPFFQDFGNLDFNDPAQLSEFLVLDAVVTLSDGVQTETLNLGLDTTKFPPLLYMGNTITGQVGNTYTLTVVAKGRTYTAQTTIRPPVALDSLRWLPEPNKDSLGACRLFFQEPATPGNIYRLFAKRQGYNAYKPVPGNSVIDDQAYNGQYIQFPFSRPEPVSSAFQSGDFEDPERFFWKKGDTISVLFCTIDVSAYEYIRTLELSAGTSGNPFSNPSTVKSNVTGGALGGFVGYGKYFTQVVAQ
ncbi:MAG: DUF4249 domain-containing protein [Flavobacteriales bacterium]